MCTFYLREVANDIFYQGSIGKSLLIFTRLRLHTSDLSKPRFGGCPGRIHLMALG